ncbi:MAG: hypothetical protein EBR82_63995, partial [Caulobacteraceae bacterium]|nr:hypothetical protein [Caulobacteraceae bacterium]
MTRPSKLFNQIFKHHIRCLNIARNSGIFHHYGFCDIPDIVISLCNRCDIPDIVISLCNRNSLFWSERSYVICNFCWRHCI